MEGVNASREIKTRWEEDDGGLDKGSRSGDACMWLGNRFHGVGIEQREEPGVVQTYGGGAMGLTGVRIEEQRSFSLETAGDSGKR